MDTLWELYLFWVQLFEQEYEKACRQVPEGVVEAFQNYYGVPESTHVAFLLQLDPEKLAREFYTDIMAGRNRKVALLDVEKFDWAKFEHKYFLEVKLPSFRANT